MLLELPAVVELDALEVLPHRDGLLDQAVEVLRDLRGEALLLEDAKDFAAGDVRDLRDAVRVPKDDADLRRRQALLRELSDVVDDLLGGDLEPRRRRPPVRQGALGDALPERRGGGSGAEVDLTLRKCGDVAYSERKILMIVRSLVGG